MSDKYLAALAGNNEGRPPVWLMRQAGRYMPSYRALKQKYSLEHLFHSPELATQITLMPIEEFGFDAAILFSDILVIHEAFGFNVCYPDSGGPFIENAPTSIKEIENITLQNVEENLHYVKKTVSLLKEELTVPLIGFSGSPFTVAAYLLDKPLKEDMKSTKALMFEHPKIFHGLLAKITEATCQYLDMQIKAGVNAIQIFDSWANALSVEDYKEFSFPYLKILIDYVKSKSVSVTLFCRGSSVLYPQLVKLRPSCISFDWSLKMQDLKEVIPSEIALQGNLDPSILRCSPEVVKKKTEDLLKSMQGCPRYIFNLGHGILPDSRVDSVKVLVDTVKTFTH